MQSPGRVGQQRPADRGETVWLRANAHAEAGTFEPPFHATSALHLKAASWERGLKLMLPATVLYCTAKQKV